MGSAWFKRGKKKPFIWSFCGLLLFIVVLEPEILIGPGYLGYSFSPYLPAFHCVTVDAQVLKLYVPAKRKSAVFGKKLIKEKKKIFFG